MSTETRTEPVPTKSERKASARAANNPADYETTEFGRRRVSKTPRWVSKLIAALAAAGSFVARLFRRPRPSHAP